MSQGKSFVIPLVIYPFDIVVSMGETDEAFMKTVRKYCLPEVIKDCENDPNSIVKMDSATDGRTVNYSQSLQTLIRLKKIPCNARGAGVLAHEIAHACFYILWRMGIGLEVFKSDECYCYLIDYVTTECYKRLNK